MPPLKVIAPALTGLATVALTAHFFASPMFQDSLSECAIHHRGPYFVAFGNNIPLGSAVDGLFCALFAAFNNIAQTLLGKSIGVMFASIYLPVQALMLILGAQQGPGHVALAIGLIAVGQLITIGVTLNIVWLPYFWTVLKRQASSGAEAAPRIVAPAIAISLAATVPVLLPTFAINAAHPIWIWGNFAFQLFPLLLLPVVQATAQARGKEAKPSYRPYVSLLRSLAIFAGVLWWVGILQALLDYDLPYAKEVAGMEKSPALMSPLLSKTLGIPHLPLRLRPTLAAEFNEGARFLLADMFAIVVAVGAATALHNEKLGSRGDKPARASVFSLLGGPGAWFMSYWASVFEHEASSTKTKKQR